MALREAGERHHDLNGGDPDVSAKAAGHNKETKARYYKKISYEEAQEPYVKYHPAFVEEWLVWVIGTVPNLISSFKYFEGGIGYFT